MSRLSGFGGSLYRGEVSIDFVGRRRQWYALSAVLLLLALGALVGRGLNYGIEFEGGAVFTVPPETCTVEEAGDAFAATASGYHTIPTRNAAPSASVCMSAVTRARAK